MKIREFMLLGGFTGMVVILLLWVIAGEPGWDVIKEPFWLKTIFVLFFANYISMITGLIACIDSWIFQDGSRES